MGGKGKWAEDGEADENQRNKASYLCAECGGGGEDITGFVGEFVGFTPLPVALQLGHLSERQPHHPCKQRVQSNRN